jgi:hypothetical protein
MDACNRSTQVIADYEYLGTSLRKINDNFQILDVNACELIGVVESLSATLAKLKIPETPKCSISNSNINNCDLVNIPPANTCVTDTRIPLNSSFNTLSDLSCSLVTSIKSLSAIVVNHPIGKTMLTPVTTPQCFYTDGISTDEYIGDSYQKIINNFKSLESTYCGLANKVNSLSSRICCPGDAPKRQDLLDRFTLQGEGGYAWNTFNFVNRDIMYAPLEYKNSYYTPIVGASYTTYAYTTSFGGISYYGLSGVLRMGAGNHNQSAIFRDGNVFYTHESGGSRGPFVYSWIKDNLHTFKDIFMPSSYAWTNCQVVLLTSGDLVELDLRNRYNPPRVILTNVSRVVAINQAHNSDCIVAKYDDTVWHVTLRSDTYTSADYEARQILNLDDSDILFAQIGDPGNSCFVCLKSDPTKIYRLTTGTRHLGSFSWLTARSNTPATLPGLPLGAGEYFVDGASNEFHYVLLTNKRILCYRGDGGSYGYGPVPFVARNLAPGVSAVSMSTSTSYSMAVRLTDGYYLLSVQGMGNYKTGGGPAPYYNAYVNMDKFTMWNNLVQNLSSGRPDIFGFGSLSCCTCLQPLPVLCAGLALEDFVTCIRLENGTNIDLE